MIISAHISPIHSNYSTVTPGKIEVDSNKKQEESVNSVNKKQETEEKRGQKQGVESTHFNNSNTKNKIESELSQAEIKQLRELRVRDREVRAHEQAHASAAGTLAKGSPSYNYQRGPDGQLYAVGGEVQIDSSAIAGDPKATAEKAAKVQRAALAPAQPSQQDRSVAAAAAALEAQARIEITQQKAEGSIEKLNARFSDKTSNSENEQNNETRSIANSEIHSKCAQCGGQHSAESHTVAVTLGETFNQSDLEEKRETQFNIAI